jgi:hypothetical protein
MSMLDQIVGDVDQIPAGVWMGALGANVVLTIATWSVARRRLRRAGSGSPVPLSTRARRERVTPR